MRGSNQLPYPGLQLGGELGLELAHGAVGVVSLDEHLGSHGRLLPKVLQAVCLEIEGEAQQIQSALQ